MDRIEKAAKAESIFGTDCVCFPRDSPPRFHWEIEVEIAAKIKCPLHGQRFERPFLIYTAKWQREKRERLIEERMSEQFKKGWYASFPRDLWPAGEEQRGKQICLKLKNGTILPAVEFNWN
jgi:hypothetical protein